MLLFDDDLNDKLFKLYCLNDISFININETYTETLATIINMMYYSIISNKINNNLNDLFMNEFCYSLLVLISILKHFNYENIQKLYRSTKCNILKQSTSVFNYYIMKPFMLCNIDYFFNLHDDHTKCIHSFKLLNNCKDNFLNLINNNFNNKKLQLIINKLLKIKSIKTNSLCMVYYKK